MQPHCEPWFARKVLILQGIQEQAAAAHQKVSIQQDCNLHVSCQMLEPIHATTCSKQRGLQGLQTGQACSMQKQLWRVEAKDGDGTPSCSHRAA